MLEREGRIKFVYNEPAVLVNAAGREHLVIGDLHIGAERPLIKSGIRVYDAEGQMLKRIRKISKEFGVKSLIILGDVKDTILYPESAENSALKTFFGELKKEGFDVIITAGNHDPHLEEIVDCKMVDELILDDFAFLHGHRWPSDDAMKSKFLFAGHNHIAIGLRDKSGAYYNQKAWLVAKFVRKYGLEKYPDANKKIQLVVLPAFNDLIMGMPIGKLPREENLSPLFRNRIFDYDGAKIYSLGGDIVGTPSKMKP